MLDSLSAAALQKVDRIDEQGSSYLRRHRAYNDSYAADDSSQGAPVITPYVLPTTTTFSTYNRVISAAEEEPANEA